MLAAALLLASCGGRSEAAAHGIASWENDGGGGDKVYVCTGGSSKRNHRKRNCKGLSRCKGQVLTVYDSFAEDKGRTPCKMCYKE